MSGRALVLVCALAAALPAQDGPAWALQPGTRVPARLELLDEDAVRIVPEGVGSAPWTLQVVHAPHRLARQRRYFLRFAARADRPREVVIGVGKATGRRTHLGLHRKLELEPEWKEYSFEFESAKSTELGLIYVLLGQDSSAVELTTPTLDPVAAAAGPPELPPPPPPQAEELLVVGSLLLLFGVLVWRQVRQP